MMTPETKIIDLVIPRDAEMVTEMSRLNCKVAAHEAPEWLKAAAEAHSK